LEKDNSGRTDKPEDEGFEEEESWMSGRKRDEHVSK
jgi:hypothetical protein